MLVVELWYKKVVAGLYKILNLKELHKWVNTFVICFMQSARRLDVKSILLLKGRYKTQVYVGPHASVWTSSLTFE